jgi:hypothetical protein
VVYAAGIRKTRDVIAQLLPTNNAKQITAATMRHLLGELVAYETLNDLELYHIDSGVSQINLLGNTTPGDGGGGLYRIATTQAPGPNKVQSGDGQYWELMYTTGYFGSVQKAAAITTTDLAPGMSAVVKNTTSGAVVLAYNDNGTIKTVTLS